MESNLTASREHSVGAIKPSQPSSGRCARPGSLKADPGTAADANQMLTVETRDYLLGIVREPGLPRRNGGPPISFFTGEVPPVFQLSGGDGPFLPFPAVTPACPSRSVTDQSSASPGRCTARLTPHLLAGWRRSGSSLSPSGGH